MKKEICKVGEEHSDNIYTDIRNLVEKYISISKKDKSIFTKGKTAYPVKMVATDEEDSVLKQASALEEPLQSKAIFFDNKRMLQNNKKCDGIVFSFVKKSNGEKFLARIEIDNRGCMIKLYEYVEEDINAALFTFINS